MFSSLFGKKDKADGKREDTQPAAVPARPNGHPPASTAPSAPPRKPTASPAPNTAGSAEAKAAAAAQATAKIDAIEKEMALEFTVSNATGLRSKFEKSADFRGQKKDKSAAGQAPATPAAEEDDFGDFGAATDLLGTTSSSDAMEIGASELAPAIEEVAVLYANGQANAAVHVLVSAIKEDHLGNSRLMGWQMLFELYQQMGKRTEFEELAIQYAARFETSPPAFVDEGGSAPLKPAPAPAVANTVVSFSGAVDSTVGAQLDKLKKVAEKNKHLRLDFNKVTRVAPEGAELLLGVLRTLVKSGHQATLTGVEFLADLIHGAVEVGRRDETDHLWMLLLELYRILGKQHEFEELSIDYCVTYEVSPPSWEPIKGFVAESGQPAPVTIAPGSAPAEHASSPDSLVFAGEIEGKADQLLGSLTMHAADRSRVEIDCSKLKRMDFAAAGNLLNALFGMAAQGKQVMFTHVNHLVAALFCVMGIQEVATVERRRL